jgi:hypothetical protein
VSGYTVTGPGGLERNGLAGLGPALLVAQRAAEQGESDRTFYVRDPADTIVAAVENAAGTVYTTLRKAER